MTDMIVIDGKEYTPAEVQAAINLGAKLVGQKHDNFGAPIAPAAHGLWSDGTTYGLFTRPGVDPNIYSAMRMPDASLLGRLFMGVTDLLMPEFEILTGVDGARGSNAASYCAEAPVAGFARLCTTRAGFGDFYMQTEKVELPKNGGRVNRADVDRRIINNLPAFPLVPDVGYDNINTTLGLAFFHFGIHAMRVMAKVLIHGSSANTGNNAETGFIKEFNGFDQLIKTGYQDIESGLFCAAADSIVEDFNEVNVTNAGFVSKMASIYRRLRDRQDQGGLGADWDGFLLMTPDMFYAITATWPCNYLTDGCSVNPNSGQAANVDTSLQVQMRDEMRRGRFLWIDGDRVPVETSRAIDQAASGPGFAAPIYFVVERALGTRVTYVEGFDMGNADNAELLRRLPDRQVQLLNGNFYASTYTQTGFCFEILFAARPRLIMRTPWLCARLENVQYNLDAYTDSPYPGDPYYVNGGRYVSEGPQTYVAS